MTQTQPPSMPSPYPAGQAPAAPPARTNTMAVLALIFAFVVAPLGIIFGIVARRQIRRTGDNGRGLATAGIVLGSIFTILGIAAVVGVIVLAAVVPKTLDTTKIETQMVSTTQQAAGGVAPTGLQCPDNVVAKAGATFTCTAQLDGQPLHYTVTQTSDKGDVTFESETFVVVATAQADLEKKVAQQAGVPVTATCDGGGKTVLISTPGTTIPCTVTNSADPTDSAQYTITIVDTKGSITFKQNG